MIFIGIQSLHVASCFVGGICPIRWQMTSLVRLVVTLYLEYTHNFYIHSLLILLPTFHCCTLMVKAFHGVKEAQMGEVLYGRLLLLNHFYNTVMCYQ